MLLAFDKHYLRIILYGLAAALWFAVFTQAAVDLWSATLLFGWITLLTVVFCVGRCRDQKPVVLPLWIPSLLILGAFWLSSVSSFDVETSVFEAWGWTFTFLAFYLFINVAD